MLQRSKWSAAMVLLLAVAAMGQIGGVKVYACDLTDLGSCLSGTTNPYVAGQQDTVYDSTHGLAYHPFAACCHDDDWNSQFHSGYDQKWSQSQSQTSNVEVNNSPGADVSVNQQSNQDQNQGPSISGCRNQCESANPCSESCDSGPCDSGCGNFAPYGFHHFGWFHHFRGCGFGGCGYGYRHVFWHGEDP